MGRQFDVEYDDFTGGHFMGNVQARQPKNQWVGANVIATADEGFLMADGGWTRPAAKIITAGAAADRITPPVVYNDGSAGVVPGSSAQITFVDGTTTVRRHVPEGNTTLSTTTLPAAVDTTIPPFVSILGNRLALIKFTGTTMYLLNPSSTAVSTVATPANFLLGTWWWNNFAFGVALGSNRLWHSAAADPTTWPATSYIDIGESNSPIVCVMPQHDALLVGKADGWWIITGVPGSTATLRRLSAYGAAPGGLVSSAGAVPIGSSALVRSGRPAQVNLLAGTQLTPFATLPAMPGVSAPSQVDMIVSAGEHALVLDTVDSSPTSYVSRLFIWSNVLRRWRYKTLPTAAERSKTSLRYWAVDDRNLVNDNLYVIASEGSGATNDVVSLYAPKEPLEPVIDATTGVFDSATVTLAEYQHNVPFKVRELLVEVDFGQPATQTAKRALSASLIANGITDLDQQFTLDTAGNAVPPMSSVRTKEWENVSATRRGHRQLVRFLTNDVAPSHTIAPRLTLQGVKVRRVIARCEAV